MKTEKGMAVKETVSVWILHLNGGSSLACGPFLSEEAAAASGGGRIEPITVTPSARSGPVTWRAGQADNYPFPPGAFPVRDGLVCRMDDVPTTSLREEYSPAGKYWWLPEGFRLAKPDGTLHTDEEYDRRYPDRVTIAERLSPWTKLTRL